MALTTAQRGYGWDHRTARHAALAAFVNGTPCPRCGQPMHLGQHLDYDHLTPIALGGINSPKVLSHRHCNRAAGARLGNKLKAARQRTSRRW
jgi:HNH endonuclease